MIFKFSVLGFWILISVMTYDFHGGWDLCTGHNSPLQVGSKDQGNMLFQLWKENPQSYAEERQGRD